LLVLVIISASVAFAEELLNDSGGANTTAIEITDPFSPGTRLCIFVREWILKGVFLVVFLVFLVGIATFSGAAFPQWREKGGMMILGAIGAVILYLIGMPSLKFLMGISVCGL